MEIEKVRERAREGEREIERKEPERNGGNSDTQL